MNGLQSHLKRLYLGSSREATRFRFGLLAFDVVTITYFIVTSMAPNENWIIYFDFAIAAVLLADFAARVLIEKDKVRHLLSVATVVDIIVIVTLLIPVIAQNFTFLRVVRALRLLRSYRVLKDLRQQFPYFAQHEDIINSIINLFVFIFFVTAVVYVTQAGDTPEITNYVDALYFTVSTLTTTGFGDVTLQGTLGHLLAVIIMVVGVGLFLRLLQTIFHPTKVHYKCKTCGLNRHDPDAVHCKHCGEILNIETQGE
ncbi:potassium channel family protein [Pseudomonadota bacterium]